METKETEAHRNIVIKFKVNRSNVSKVIAEINSAARLPRSIQFAYGITFDMLAKIQPPFWNQVMGEFARLKGVPSCPKELATKFTEVYDGIFHDIAIGTPSLLID